MGIINILSEELSNQIAAGEVIEGPSSVVKELIENSIDAGSKKISVEIANNYRNIKVADNGFGILKEDLGLAFKRHATSKIFELKDIYNLYSNGFRGEALASISSVSKVTCISKRRGLDKAYKFQIVSGDENLIETGAPEGTTIWVEDLFYNTPARLKFLKSNNKERNIIIDLLRAFSFSHPEISFVLKIDDKEILKTHFASENNLESLRKSIKDVFGKEIERFLYPLDYNTGDIKLEGFVTGPEFTRSDRRGVFSIVNQRILSCKVIKAAVDNAYKDILPPHKYPIAIVCLSLSPEDLDVNIHPNKKQLKYKDSNLIYRTVSESVNKSLRDAFYKSYSDYQIPLEKAPEDLLTQNSVPQTFNFDSSETTSIFKNDEILDQDTFHIKEKENSNEFISRINFINFSILSGVVKEDKIHQFANKTNFEIFSSDEDIFKTVLAKGECIGPNWFKEKILLWVKSLSLEILNKEKEKFLLKINNEESLKVKRSRPNSKPSIKELEEIWLRDNYTCSYCGIDLMHPSEVEKLCQEAPVEKHQEIQEHLATYDHHLPASKYPILNKDSRNLYSSCKKCNMSKSDSLALKTWSPKINEKK